MGIDFADTIKVRRTTNKGTKVLDEEPVMPLEWIGESFQTKELERLKLAGDMMIMTNKGTSKMKASEIKPRQVMDQKGRWISINKGTKRIQL